MTREQLEIFAESLGNGWEFRPVTEGGWGVWRNIKNQGCPPQYFVDETATAIIEETIYKEQQTLIEQDKNGLTISGRSGGWIGWTLDDLDIDDETSAWKRDRFPTIKETVRQEVIVMADEIDAKLREMNTNEYWDNVFNTH